MPIDASGSKRISLTTRLESDRLLLRPPHPSDIPLLYRALRRNADYLRPFSPAFSPPGRPTLALAAREVEKGRTFWRNGVSFALYCFLRAEKKSEARIIGRITLGRVTHGPFQNAYLGYFMDRDEQGKGLMSEAVRRTLEFAFRILQLHRVQAAIMPRNVPSLRVVEKCGFRREGFALRYLQIAGVWEDHEIFAMTSEEWPRDGAISRSSVDPSKK